MFQTIAASLSAAFLLYGGWVIARELVTRALEDELPRTPAAAPRPALADPQAE